jgi:TrmH family RNA methyltransferase
MNATFASGRNSPPKVQAVSSRDNPLIQRLRKHAADTAAYRKLDEVWLEGDHLCEAALVRGRTPQIAVIADTAWLGEHGLAQPGDAQAKRLTDLALRAPRITVVPAALWAGFTQLESPARLGFVLALQPEDAPTGLLPGVATLVLDRVQDAGNVGSMLRSASAMGVGQVLAIKGTAALWSGKVLRAGMGAHFGLHLVEQLAPEALADLGVPLVATSSHAENVLHQVNLPALCAWVMGHEGQGVGEALMARCALTVRIPQPGGEESLNVAAAAAVCLYESLRRQSP